MSHTWILVANQSSARLFATGARGKGMALLRDIAHSEGHLKNQDINADRPGRTFDSHGDGRHAMGKSESPKEHEVARFAGELAKVLDEGRTHNRFSRLVLVAEDGFLGTLKGELNDHTLKLVTATVRKDYAHVNDADLPALLETEFPF